MVYESDFYTTRRPYSSRPIVSSYSVTVRTEQQQNKTTATPTNRDAHNTHENRYELLEQFRSE